MTVAPDRFDSPTLAARSAWVRPAPESDAAITLAAVDKRFGRTHAVRSLDLVVPRGSLCGFLGPNGAGKSTSIRIIMSIIYPDSGSVRVLGGSALERKDRIGYLPEERGLYRTMRVREFLAYMGRLKGLDAREASRRAAAWLERVNLPGVAKKKCQELSKGMQQKVQFITAVLHDPELLILDEPFSGLDPVNSKLLSELVQELNREGRTIIFSTHQMYQAEQLCDRVVLINRGEKLLDLTLDEVHKAFDVGTIVVEPLGRDGGMRESIRAIEGVHDVVPVGDALEVHVERDFDTQDVMRSIVDTGPVRSVALRRTSLDDVFIEVVEATGGAAPYAKEELARG